MSVSKGRRLSLFFEVSSIGSIPSDYPFVSHAGAKETVFSYGHRDPQGMAKHPGTGEIWVHEQGSRGGDEMNVALVGVNYGWRVVS